MTGLHGEPTNFPEVWEAFRLELTTGDDPLVEPSGLLVVDDPKTYSAKPRRATAVLAGGFSGRFSPMQIGGGRNTVVDEMNLQIRLLARSNVDVAGASDRAILDEVQGFFAFRDKLLDILVNFSPLKDGNRLLIQPVQVGSWSISKVKLEGGNYRACDVVFSIAYRVSLS